MQIFFKFGFISSLVAVVLGASGSGFTWDLYQDTLHRPILLYQCYRTGVTIEPEGTVNFTVMLDGTQQSNGKGAGATWTATKNTAVSYTRGSIDFSYDDASSSIVLEDQAVNGDDDSVVYKIYDGESSCGNAAALLKVVDPKQTKGFTFVREVAGPTQVCVKTKLCAQ